MNILECKALTKRYGGKSALEGVELSIEPGRIVGLLGPNGSGKTTLIKLANGLLTPTSGEILIDGKAPSPETKAIVSYLPDRNALPDWMTVAQTVGYYADFYADFRRDAAQEMIQRLGLDVSQRVKTLSKGTREKLLLTPTSGEILIDGKAPSPETKAIVSYLPDRNALPDWMTVAQTVGYYADFYADFRRDAAQEMIQRLGLDVSQRVKTLSKGTREKLQLILVMSRAAKLYLLDEPIGGVDPATRDYILRTIIGNYNEDASVVISTHLIADVEQVLDEVIFLQNGRVERHTTVDAIRGETGKSVDELFREVFKC